jgi:hypothetical protein
MARSRVRRIRLVTNLRIALRDTRSERVVTGESIEEILS